MASCPVLNHPDEIHVPRWVEGADRPVVDGKYNDPKTGELRAVKDGEYFYSGPPAVDIVVSSLHDETTNCIWRAQREFPMEKMLCQIAKVVGARGLKVDSVTATMYFIRVVLVHELTKDEFYEIALDMTNGIWGEEEKKN